MAFHELKVHGPMRLKLIKTFNNEDCTGHIWEEHQNSVNTFNKAHIVFFNQDTKAHADETGVFLIVTPVLYADGIPTPEQTQLPQLGDQQ